MKRLDAGRTAEGVLADVCPDVDLQLLEHPVTLGFVLEDRVTLAVGAQPNAVAKAVHLVEVLLPESVDGVEDGITLDGCQGILFLETNLEFVCLLGLCGDVVKQERLVAGHFGVVRGLRFALGFALGEFAQAGLGNGDGKGQRGPVGKLLEFPVRRVDFAVAALLHLVGDHSIHDVEQFTLHLVGVHDLVAEPVDFRALLVHHVVVLERAFADLEVMLLDVFLGFLDGRIEHAALERFSLLHALFDVAEHLVAAGEDAEQVVLQ